MAEVDFEAVLEFLRGNGLSECESALLEDIMEKSQMGSSDSVKSFFPTVPPPSPLRIPPTPIDGGESEEGSSDDEFVSLGSSTTELSSSGTKTFFPSFSSSCFSVLLII